MAVLNPSLVAQLKRCFGAVSVANPGERMRVLPTRNLFTGTPRLDFIQRGEQYRISCPYCTDTRQRLYISHMWGKEDAHGRSMTFLAKCFNEDCLRDPQNRHDFVTTLNAVVVSLREAHVNQGQDTSEEAHTVEWPGEVVPLDQLRPDHKARAYLVSRGFDPDLLSRHHGICYCSESRFLFAKDRIIIPVFVGRELRGWQARYIGELPWKGREQRRKQELPPKYFSCPGSKFRSCCIYNWDRMKQWSTGVICEGPADIWRFGSMAGCIFGNTLTDIQKRKLLAVFQRRSLVLLLDPEEFDSKATRSTVQWFRQRMPGKFAAVKLPDGVDPGSLDRDLVKGFVKDEAATQGVKVVYRLWSK